MKKITIHFNSNGEKMRKTAILTDSLRSLSKAKANQATDIADYSIDGFWSIIFHEEENRQYEVEFKIVDNIRTMEPIKAITWKADYIEDVQNVTLIKIS